MSSAHALVVPLLWPGRSATVSGRPRHLPLPVSAKYSHTPNLTYDIESEYELPK